MATKDTTDKPDRIARKEYMATLKCVLTIPEIVTAAEHMSDASTEVTKLEGELASVKKQLQAQIESAKCKLSQYGNMVRDKFEYRAVKCEQALNYTRKKVRVTRLDTEEIIEQREMTTDETQMGLALEEKKEDSKKA